MHSTSLPKFSTFPLRYNYSGWLLTISFIAMTFIPRSFDDALFVDGLAYASIARNMAIGLGTFWEPFFAESFWLAFNDRCSFFCEHPPLMFGLQSLLFRILGDTTLVENLYNAIVLIVTMFLIHLIWKKLFEDQPDFSEFSWLAVLFWYGFRIVWWSVPNNLLDTTMAAFCLASCYLQLLAFSESKFNIVYWVSSSVMVALACLTKGPVGLFPIAFPLIYAVVFGKSFMQQAFIGVTVLVSVFSLILTLLLLYPPAQYFLSNYFQGQVMLALLQKREKISNHWTAHLYLVKLLLVNIIPHILILVTLFLNSLYGKFPTKFSLKIKKVGLLTLLTSLSIILPMLASVKQADYYLMPAFPFIGLFFAATCVEMIYTLIRRLTIIPRLFLPVFSVFCIVIMGYKLLFPNPDTMFEIARNISKYVPHHAKIYLPKKISLYSEIHTPFQRYSALSIAFKQNETKYLYFDNPKDNTLDSLKRAGSCRIISLGNDATLAIAN